MILDHVASIRRYAALHPAFDVVFRFIARSEFAALPLGRHDIDGGRAFAVIERGPAVGRQAARLEAHHKFIDVRVIIEGTDVVGWKPTEHCKTLAVPYDPGRDLIFFADIPDTWTDLPPGMVAILFPEDAHAPLGGKGELHRAVVKVAV